MTLKSSSEIYVIRHIIKLKEHNFIVEQTFLTPFIYENIRVPTPLGCYLNHFIFAADWHSFILIFSQLKPFAANRSGIHVVHILQPICHNDGFTRLQVSHIPMFVKDM